MAGCQSAPDPAAPAPAAATATAPGEIPTSTRPPAAPGTASVQPAAVPRLVSLPVGQAQAALARLGLRWSVAYTLTRNRPTGTVVGQSRTAGSSAAPGTVIALVIAKAPPPTTTPPRTSAPPRTTSPPPPPARPSPPAGNCDRSYPDVCLHDGIGDYDCQGGSGNGPNYVAGPLKVLPPDPFDLDRDGDGIGCEKG